MRREAVHGTLSASRAEASESRGRPERGDAGLCGELMAGIYVGRIIVRVKSRARPHEFDEAKISRLVGGDFIERLLLCRTGRPNRILRSWQSDTASAVAEEAPSSFATHVSPTRRGRFR